MRKQVRPSEGPDLEANAQKQSVLYRPLSAVEDFSPNVRNGWKADIRCLRAEWLLMAES
jgi:hypothetical protein